MRKKAKKDIEILPKNNNGFPPFIDELFDKIGGGSTSHFEFVDHGNTENLIATVLNSTKYLTGAIIENRVRNSEKIKDEDIYNIYSKSFKTVLKEIELKN